jgi:hypothetical protein
MTGSGTYQIKSWDEQPYHEEEGETKLCRAEITQAYEGTMAGESSLQYLMVCRWCGWQLCHHSPRQIRGWNSK